MISYLILEESSSDDESEAPQVSTGISILTLDKLALDNVYLNYLRKKAKDAEETPEDSPPEVRKPKKRPKFKKSKTRLELRRYIVVIQKRIELIKSIFLVGDKVTR